MAALLFLNVLDVARALGPEPTKATPDRVATWILKEYLSKPGGGFNYNPAINVTFDLFRGAVSQRQAEMHCLNHGNPKGRRQNADAVTAIAPYAAQNVSTCYRIGMTAVVVGRIKGNNVYVGIKAPIVRVRAGEAFVVMPGFRMSYRPVETEIDVACSIALANLARDDFSRADFEYLYAGRVDSDGREFRVIRGRDRQVFDRDAVDWLLDIYVNGLAVAANQGADLGAPNLAGYRILDPREPWLL